MPYHYFKCNSCSYMFLTGTNLDSKTLICGEGCGGVLMNISEEEAMSEADKMLEDGEYR